MTRRHLEEAIAQAKRTLHGWRLRLETDEGDAWDVPLWIAAVDRAHHYAPEFDGCVLTSLKEDTIPCIEEDNGEVEDWAKGNMDWSDFADHAAKVKEADPPDMQDLWLSCPIEVVRPSGTEGGNG